jgi:conjugal transfer mating pair stabilization protein TraN
MSRIFNEQGRTQIGKGYGDTKNPDCSGFTISELEQLDMSKMDLSEFTRDIVPNALNTEKLNQRATDTVNTNVNNYFNSTP